MQARSRLSDLSVFRGKMPLISNLPLAEKIAVVVCCVLLAGVAVVMVIADCAHQYGDARLKDKP